MFGFNLWEILIFLFILLLLFGGTRIPALMRSVGQSITEFKKGVKGVEEEIEKTDDSK